MLSMSMPSSLTPILEKLNTSQAERDTGKIYQTNSFKDGLYFIEEFRRTNPTKKISAKIDIDNTLLTYTHTLGTDHWFDDMFKKLMGRGLTVDQAKEQLLPLYLDVVRNLHADDIQLIEEDTPEILQRLQDEGVDVVALTSRGSYILEQTLDHLAKFNINFNKGSYADKEKILPQSPEGLLTQGMILTGGKHKGLCMMSALEDFGDLPDFIIMWDDKLENLERVRSSVCAYNEKMKATSGFVPVQFVGIRYSRLDHMIQNVDRHVTEIQEQYFKRILSDDHARAIHRADQKKHRVNYIAIDHQPQLNTVTIAVSKHENFLKLQSICGTLVDREIKGTTREVLGKPKLARQFVLTMAQFTACYLDIREAGIIEPSQMAVLDPVFSAPLPRVTPQFQAASTLLPSAANDDDVQAQPAGLSVKDNSMRTLTK
ncbi:MAG: DUF2608 domain-containing protein [Candidatus Berkiella sp.]